MTKQLKKGLVAVLIVLMAVLVGFTSNAVIGASRAEDLPEVAKKQIEQFEARVTELKELGLEDTQINAEYLLTGILGKKTEEKEASIEVGEKTLEQAKFEGLNTALKVWNAYNSAKLQIPELTNYAYTQYINSELAELFKKYDEAFTSADAYKNFSRFSGIMKPIADNFAPYTTYDAGASEVEAMTERINKWWEEGAAYEANIENATSEQKKTLHYYIYYSTGISRHYEEYFRALGRIQSMEKLFDEIEELIDDIEYYDEDLHTMKGGAKGDPAYDHTNEKHTVVMDSEPSIDAVTDKLEKNDVFPGGVSEADYKHIEGIEDYLAAVEQLQSWYDLIEEVNELIEDAYNNHGRKKGEVYYTIRDFIKKANDKYDELVNASRYEGGDENEENYNDLQKQLATKYPKLKAELDEMNADLEELYGKIKALEEMIEKIDELDEASYTIKYRTAIEEAEKKFKELDKDVIAHDEEVYPLVKERNALSAENGELFDAIKKIVAKRNAVDYDEKTDKTRAEDDKVLAENPVKLSVNSARILELQSQLIEDDHYMFDFEKDFIVEGYEKLMDSRAQYDKWTKQIKDLMARVEEIIRLQSDPVLKGEGVTAILNELLPYYSDMEGRYWSGKDWMKHKTAFLYAADKEGDEPIYVHQEDKGDIYDEKYLDKYNFLINSPDYPPQSLTRDEDGNTTNYDVLSYFYYLWARIQTLVNDVESGIAALDKKVEADGCVYGHRAELLDLWVRFQTLNNYAIDENPANTKDYRNWVSNHQLLEDMFNEYVHEEKLVRAWAELMETKGIELPVGVADWDAIAELETAFKAIVHYDTTAAIAEPVDFGKFGKFLAQTEETFDVVQGDKKESKTLTYADIQKKGTVEAPNIYEDILKNAKADEKYASYFEDLDITDDIVVDYSKQFETYKRAIQAREDLKQEVEELAKRMAKYDEDENPDGIDTSGNVDLDKVAEWTENVREVEATFKGMADKKTKGDIDYTGTQDKFFTGEEATFADEYANYLKALQQIEKYEVEAAIEAIEATYNDEAKTLDEDSVTLADGELIATAWAKHNAYLSKYAEELQGLDPDNNEEDRKTRDDFLLNEKDTHQNKEDGYDIRNDWKLHLCWDKLNEINEELNAWMRDVINLYDNIDDDAEISEIHPKLDEFNAEEYSGYPLAISPEDKKGNKYELNAEDVLAYWTENIQGDSDKEKYVEKAKTVLDALMTASDEVINTLNDAIVAVSEQIKADGLTADKIEEVQRIKDLFDKLHPTQQDKVELTDEYLDALDTLNAIAAFKNMVGELYREVVKEGNVTSFVQFYIDTVTNLYNQFPAGIRQAFDEKENSNCIIISEADSATGKEIVGYTDIMAAIQAAYDEVGDEGAFHLKAVKEMIEQFKDELIKALQDAMAMDEEAQLPSISEAFKNFEAKLTASYQAAIEDAINGENGVNKKIESLNSEIASLKQQVADLKATAGDKTALEGITSRIEILEQNIQALQTALGELTEFKTTYEDLLKDINDGKYATDEELTNALNKFETEKLTPALNRLTTAEGEITTLKSQVSNIEGRLATVEEQAKKAYEELFGTDGKSDTIYALEKQIAALEKNLEEKLGTAGEGVVGSIEDRIAELKTQLAGLQSQLATFQEKVDAADTLGDRVAALGSAKTALENADKQLQTNIDNVKKELEDKINGLQDQIDNVKKELEEKINGLQDQIDSLKSTSTTLTVLVIILAVMVLAALACIVLLFIKRNKSNN